MKTGKQAIQFTLMMQLCRDNVVMLTLVAATGESVVSLPNQILFVLIQALTSLQLFKHVLLFKISALKSKKYP